MAKISAADRFRKSLTEAAIKSTYDTKVLGTRAIGLDRVDSNNFENKSAAEYTLISKKILAGTYKFTKYKEKLISKGAGKLPRQLSIPTIRDRLALRVVCDFLFSVFPEAKPELPQDKIELIREAIAKNKFTHFIKIDLKDFFPSIAHKLLLAKLYRRVRIAEFKTLLQRALENPTVAEGSTAMATANSRGVAQGLSISNVLAEIFMMDVDKRLKDVAPVCLRFVDDILILTDKDAPAIFELACAILRKEKLDPHPLGRPGSKTQIGQISDGFEFLGYKLQPNSISVRRTSIVNFESSIVGVFTELKHRTHNAKESCRADHRTREVSVGTQSEINRLYL